VPVCRLGFFDSDEDRPSTASTTLIQSTEELLSGVGGFARVRFSILQIPSEPASIRVQHRVRGARLRQIRPGIVTVNYGCPGESTATFNDGGCIWTITGHQLHDLFEGSQLQAAIKFLEAHRKKVSPITLTLWGNDLPLLLGPCTVNNQIDLTCVQANAPGFIAGLAGRIFSILQKLRSAARMPRSS
jgi:hypothetical protein